MSARAIQDQKVGALATLARQAVHGKVVAPAGPHQGNRIANIETRSDSALGNSQETERFHAKTNHGNESGRLAVKAKGRVLFVDPIDVIVAKAQGNYVALVHKCGSYLVRETMATAEQKLAPLGFVRIHRSILVNSILVNDLRRDNTGTYVLRTIDGNEHPVGRAYKDNLKAIARSWLGFELV